MQTIDGVFYQLLHQLRSSMGHHFDYDVRFWLWAYILGSRHILSSLLVRESELSVLGSD